MRRIAWLLWIGGFFSALACGWPSANARAEVNLHAEATDEITNSTLKDKVTGSKVSTDRNRLDQIYNLDIDERLYPNLSIRAGGIFQSTDETIDTDGTKTDTSTDLLHPFVDVNLTNPIFTTGGGFEKTEIRQSGTNQTSSTDTLDQLHGRFLWSPVDLPRMNLNYTKTHRYDDLNTSDLQEDDLNLSLRYDWHDIFTNYSYVKDTTDDRITGLQSRHDSHDGRISLSREVTKDLDLNASYRANYATDQWSGSGQAYLAPIFLGGTSGFYLLDDRNPATWDANTQPLAGNFLVDGVKSGSSPVNLGLNGDETKNVSIGLDFGFATQLSTIRVWVDRDATEVGNAFNWTVYTSEDKLNWTVLPLAHPVKYVGGIDNYFEFTLTDSVAAPVTTRYIKLVTTPLTNAADVAGHFRDLFITEIETFRLQQGDITRRNFDNSADMGLVWRFDPKTSMGYSVFYRSQKSDTENLSQRDTALSQTLNLNRIINPIFSNNLRGTREERQTSTQDTLDYSYGASLIAGWLDTFRQSLSYNGSWSEIDQQVNTEGPAEQIDQENSVILRSIAQLYRGWSATVDFGYAWGTPANEGPRHTNMFRVESSIIPNPKLTINTSYTYSRTLSEQLPSEDQRTELSVAFNPTTAISLFTRYTIINQSNTSKVYQDYSVDWSPFPDGAMQFFVSYGENLTNEGDDTKIALAGFDWRVNSATVLRPSYSISQTESLFTRTDSQVISVTLRVSL